MFGKNFELNEQTIPVIEEIGKHMPGGFFIYRAEGDEELLYVNKVVLDIFGCNDIDDFKELTGYTFRGMVHPDDYRKITDSINDQIAEGDNSEQLDYVEYRIIRKDGTVRWVDDYGHYTETEAYGGVYYVFISDITEKKESNNTDAETRNAVIEALSESYHTVWLIRDVETGMFSLYRGDTEGQTIHGRPIRDALSQMNYNDAKEYYIRTSVAEEDQERLQRDLTLEKMAERLRENPQFNVTYLRKMTDGSEKYFRIEFARVNMPNDKMGIVCGFKNVDDEIREEHRIQTALLEAERKERENRRLIKEMESAAKLADLMGSVASLLTNIPAMSFSKDAETGVYLACNQSFAEYAHKDDPSGVIGLTDHEIFDPVTADHFVEDDRKAISMEEPYIFFEDVPDAAGNPRSFQTTKMKFTDERGKLCTLGLCVDVTEMSRIKQAEAEAKVKQQELEEKIALQDQLLQQKENEERQLELITAMASDYRSVYYVNLDENRGVCYQVHGGFEDDLKVGDRFDFQKYMNDYADRYITEEFRADFKEFISPQSIRNGLKDQRIISFRFLVKRDGLEKYEMIRFAGVRHPEDREDHKVHSVGAGISDVDADTRQTLDRNRALMEALDAAEQANKAKTAFLSNMSHEIRTPMNAIIGLNNIALNDPDTSEKTREYLEKMGVSARHLLNIINDILDMSRIESGRMVIKNEEFSFSKLLEQINTIINGQCRDKGLTYDCRVIDTLSDYYIGDDMKLRQVLINILGNAVKFTEPGGKITFTIEEIARFDNKSTIRFVIKDTGIGMSKEYLPKIFDPFSQENSSSVNRYGSTGLGMPITKSIVELMTGNIEVESEKGVGSTFTVVLTLDNSQRQNSNEEDDMLPHELRVLVIDDDPIACEHARIVLGQAGVNCDTAGSGAEGIDLVTIHHARMENYDLILVDWKMPEMDGVETTRRIRSIVGKDTPIIILTSYNWDDVAEEARKAGVDSFVPKPLFAGTVMDEFREAFRRKNTAIAGVRTDLRGKRILLAEDMDVNAQIMVMLLGMRQMDVDVAENGRIAVEMFSSSSQGYYDAILMDMRMPEMDGLEATRAIRDLDRDDARKIPIIALTANAFDEDVQRSLQAGLNAHLSKPVEPESLFSTLENLIE